jgi:hypothetical protein
MKSNSNITRQTASKYLAKLSLPYKRENGAEFQILQSFNQWRENIYLRQR